MQLDNGTELALRTALARVGQLMNHGSECASPTLSRFFDQCAKNGKPAPSTIPNAGMGLVAARNIKQGTIISLYPMHCLGLDLGDYSPLVHFDADQQHFEEKENEDYVLNIIGSRPLPLLPPFVDVSSLFLDVNPFNEARPGWSSHYINDGATVEVNSEEGAIQYYQKSAKARNCVLVPFGPSPIMASVATKKIKKGQEFFTSYGCMYWLEKVLGENEECTEITEAIQEEAQASAKVLYQAMKGIEVTQQGAAMAIEEAFSQQASK